MYQQRNIQRPYILTFENLYLQEVTPTHPHLHQKNTKNKNFVPPRSDTHPPTSPPHHPPPPPTPHPRRNNHPALPPHDTHAPTLRTDHRKQGHEYFCVGVSGCVSRSVSHEAPRRSVARRHMRVRARDRVRARGHGTLLQSHGTLM